MKAKAFRTMASACVLMCLASAGQADNNAAAMVMRIEPASSGMAKVLRDGHAEEVAFMMPLFEGDELVIESPATTVQVRMFGGDDVTVSTGEALTIGAEAEERTLLTGLLSALSDKVFRNNQVSRRNLVTRSDGTLPDFVLLGFGASDEKQALVEGRRSILLRWSLDLDSVSYRIEDTAKSHGIASGTVDGDFVFVDDLDIKAGREYRIIIENADGILARAAVVGVESLPALTPVDERFGAAGVALSLLELANRDNGHWKFEAIQGVLGLSPDDIDRATLIEEIAAL